MTAPSARQPRVASTKKKVAKARVLPPPRRPSINGVWGVFCARSWRRRRLFGHILDKRSGWACLGKAGLGRPCLSSANGRIGTQLGSLLAAPLVTSGRSTRAASSLCQRAGLFEQILRAPYFTSSKERARGDGTSFVLVTRRIGKTPTEGSFEMETKTKTNMMMMMILACVAGACTHAAPEPDAIHFDSDGVHLDAYSAGDRVILHVVDDVGLTLLEVEESLDRRSYDSLPLDTVGESVPGDEELHVLRAENCQDIGNGWEYCAGSGGWCLSSGPSACGDWICCGWDGDCIEDSCW